MAAVLRLLFLCCVVLAAAFNPNQPWGTGTTPADSVAAQAPFSCYINGQPWWPAGNGNGAPDLIATFDPSIHHGTLEIAAHRVDIEAKEYLYLRAGSLLVAAANITPAPDVKVSVQTQTCGTSGEAEAFNGKVEIVSLSMATRQIAGHFWCDVVSDCGVLRITSGRFVLKF